MRSVALLVMLVAATPPAHAQSRAASFLRSVVDIGQTIWITGPDGQSLLGTVASISDTTIDMKMAASLVPYRLEDVRLIEVPDPVINGLLVGALIGSLIGSLPAWDIERPRSNALAWTLAIGGIGAAAGAFGDSLRQGRKTIYRGCPPSPSRRWSFPGALP